MRPNLMQNFKRISVTSLKIEETKDMGLVLEDLNEDISTENIPEDPEFSSFYKVHLSPQKRRTTLIISDTQN